MGVARTSLFCDVFLTYVSRHVGRAGAVVGRVSRVGCGNVVDACL